MTAYNESRLSFRSNSLFPSNQHSQIKVCSIRRKTPNGSLGERRGWYMFSSNGSFGTPASSSFAVFPRQAHPMTEAEPARCVNLANKLSTDVSGVRRRLQIPSTHLWHDLSTLDLLPRLAIASILFVLQLRYLFPFHPLWTILDPSCSHPFFSLVHHLL